MVMDRSLLIRAIATGIVATSIAYAIVSLLNMVYWGQSQILDQLSIDGSLGSITYDMYTLTNSPFFLGAIAILLLEILTGVFAFLLTRPIHGRPGKSYMASIIAGLLPAILWGISACNNWRIGMSQLESHTNVRPAEPSPEFIVFGIICFEVAACIMASAAGGWLAQFALESREQT
jgi:hypothetical protein